MLMHFSCIRTIFFYLIDIDLLLVLFYLSLSLSLSIWLVCSVAPKKSNSTPSWNSLHSGTSTSDSTPFNVWFYDDKAWKNFSRRGIHLKCQVFLSDFSDTDLPTVIYSQGWESLYGIPITCPSVIIQEFYSNMHGFDTSVPQFVTRIRGTRIVVTPDLISKVLHVPRVAQPDYPGRDSLRIVSKDELSFLFCKTPSFWDDHQNTFCSGFAKGLRFLNIVMTFIFHPLFHYNSITESRVRFLLSLLEDISIDSLLTSFYFL